MAQNATLRRTLSSCYFRSHSAPAPRPTNELEYLKKLITGQYWRVVNVDKRQELGDWSKLGECSFHDSPNTLVNYPAVPSSTTSSPDPYWIILANGEWAGDRIICVADYAEDVPGARSTATGCESFPG